MLPGKKRGCGHHGEIGTCWGGRSRGSRSARPRGQHQNRGEDQVLLLGDCWELHRGWTLTSYTMETLICPIPPLSCLQPLGTRLLPSWAPSSVLDPSARICTGCRRHWPTTCPSIPKFSATLLPPDSVLLPRGPWAPQLLLRVGVGGPGEAEHKGCSLRRQPAPGKGPDENKGGGT